MRVCEQTELAIAAKRLGIPDWKGRPELKSRILLLYQRHGVRSDKRCKSCRHLCCNARAKRYYKCQKSPITGGAATDWRVNWPACGLWEADGDV